MTALLQFLNSICPLSEGLQNYLTANLVRIEIPKKDFILKKGHNWFDIYFIQKGLVVLYPCVKQVYCCRLS
jgi:hypothetical protein